MKDMCAALAVMFTLLDSNSIFVQQVDGMRLRSLSTQSFPFLHYVALSPFQFVTIVHKNNFFADLTGISGKL